MSDSEQLRSASDKGVIIYELFVRFWISGFTLTLSNARLIRRRLRRNCLNKSTHLLTCKLLWLGFSDGSIE
jgi:hypothetical protein